ncbi:hypothetical protein ACQY0O_003521 [Thecaphora frezii]
MTTFQMAPAARPASGDSNGSSSSLAPTNGSQHTSLFTSEESRFITDSLSSAESFDPFTIGAPGFKVPNLLPPNLVSNQADHHQQLFQQQQQQQHDRSAHQRGWSTSTAAMMLPMTTDAGLSFAFAGASSNTGSVPARADPFAGPLNTHRPSQWQTYGHRSGAAGPLDANGLGYNQMRHASFSGADSGTAMSSGYGKNKAWQLEQLSYLEAAANAANRQRQPQHMSGHEPSLSRSLSLASNLYDYSQARAAASTAAAAVNDDDRNSSDLAMLGLNFPSSHSFPFNDARQHQQLLPHHSQYRHQQQQQSPMSLGPESDPSQLPGTTASVLQNETGLDERGANRDDRSTTPKALTPSSAAKRPWASIAADRRGSAASRNKSSTPTRLHDATAEGDARGRSPSVRAPWTASSSGAVASEARASPHSKATDRSVAVSKALARLAQLDLDLATASQRLPETLRPYFVPPSEEKRKQPHLELLKRQHQEAGLVDENGKEIGKEERKRAAELEKEKDAKKAAGAQGHTLLTEAEKKANHIASEQKRRANIRKGYELLCDIVPPLKEALEREARKGKDDEGGGGGHQGGSDDEGGGDDEDEDEEDEEGAADPDVAAATTAVSKKKKKGGGKRTKKRAKKRDGEAGGCEIDGERIDGRAGPRSEAVVLMKSLEHISTLLEKHRALLGRRNRARLALAKAQNLPLSTSEVEADLDAHLVRTIRKLMDARPSASVEP